MLPDGSDGKESAYNAGDLGSIPGLGRSPGEGNGYPLQYFGLENSMDGIAHVVPKSWTQLNDFHFHFQGEKAKYTTASLVCFYLWSQKAHLYYENPRYPYVCLCMQTKILKTTSETEKSSYLKEIRFAIFYIVIF